MYEYTVQKLTQAIECLATWPWDIRERLKDKYIYYLHVLIQEDDFPVNLRDDRKKIIKSIHNTKNLKITSIDKIIIEHDGLIAWIRKKRNKKTAKNIAHKIFNLRQQLSEIKVNPDIELEN